MSRSCFEAWKLTDHGPRKGRYFFLDGHTVFDNRSMLGGHWWEGHPFQTGPLSTLETPVPRWVNGSIHLPAGWPQVACCGWGIPRFIPTSCRLTLSRIASPTVSTMLASTTFSDPSFTQFYFQPSGQPNYNEVTIHCPGEAPHFWASFCGLPVVYLRAFNAGITTPGYLFSLNGPVTRAVWVGPGPDRGQCVDVRSIRVDVYGVIH